MLKVGLTGSIAVGKSFVCDLFRQLGCRVLDADQTAREVVEPGTIGLHRIVKEFGSDILDGQGRLDRKRLGSIVFADQARRQTLNAIVHPLVLESQDAWLTEAEKEGARIAIVDAALMIESGGYKRFDKLIVVWCEPDIQLQRLMRRDGLSEAEAARRVAAQMPQEEKKQFADYLVDSSRGFESVRDQVTGIHDKLRLYSV